MKLCALGAEISDLDSLRKDYKSAERFGVLRLGDKHLYFKYAGGVYYIAYSEMKACFRRVMLVPARFRLRKIDIPVEYAVICTHQAEAAQVQLPGKQKAQEFMEALKAKCPDMEFQNPKKK